METATTREASCLEEAAVGSGGHGAWRGVHTGAADGETRGDLRVRAQDESGGAGWSGWMVDGDRSQTNGQRTSTVGGVASGRFILEQEVWCET